MSSQWAEDIAREAVFTHGALQKPEELADMLDVLRGDPPRVILEIGSDKGGTLYAWRAAFPDAALYAIDLTAGQPGTPEHIKYGTGRDREAHGAWVLERDSHTQNTLALIQTSIALQSGRPVDLLFIDADHSLEGVRLDYAMYSPLVRPGGVVMFHDICIHPDSPLAASGVGVHEFWETLQSPFKHEIVHPSLDWGGIGYLYTPKQGDHS